MLFSIYIKHHIKKWGSGYTDDPKKTLQNLVAGGYNKVNPQWAPSIYKIYPKNPVSNNFQNYTVGSYGVIKPKEKKND